MAFTSRDLANIQNAIMALATGMRKVSVNREESEIHNHQVNWILLHYQILHFDW